MEIGTSSRSLGHPIKIRLFSVCKTGSYSVAFCRVASLSSLILMLFSGSICSSSKAKTVKSSSVRFCSVRVVVIGRGDPQCTSLSQVCR